MSRAESKLRARQPRYEALLAFACLLALASGGCGRGHERAQAKHSTVSVLVCCGEWSPVSPHEDEPAKFLVFLPLVARNAKGELEGRLAQSWEHSLDYRTWTIHLRKDVHWQDGVPVTAQDIKFTLDLLSNPRSCGAPSPPGAVTAQILDDYTYMLTYRERAGGSPLDDWTVYYPKHLLEKLDPQDCPHWEFWRHPVGAGPYRHVRTVPQTMMEFEADPNYYRGKPKIERVALKFFPGGYIHGPIQLTELLSGNVDAISEAVPMDLVKLSGDRRFRTYFVNWMSSIKGVAMFWNERYPLFRDPTVRRALTLAVNRRELNRVLNLPDAGPIFDALFTPRQLQLGDLPAPLPYDPEEAKRLLDKAGWRDPHGNGVRERDGRAFRFTALTARIAGTDQATVYVQAALRRVGIQMDIEITDFDVFRDRVRSGNFQAMVNGISFELEYGGPGGPFFYFGENSPLGYSNPKVTALLKEAAATMNPDEYDQIYRELWPIFRADMPATFLFQYHDGTAAHRRLRGLSTPWRADPVQYLGDLWLDDRGDQ